MLKILNFTSGFTWDVSLAGDFISENSLEIFCISQVISRGTCHRHVTGHTTRNEIEPFSFELKLVKKRGTHTTVYMECHLFFTCARGHVSLYSQGDSQVKLFFWN